jgi:hypothetical protein
LLLNDSKPVSAQAPAQDVYRAVVTSADSTAASARTPLFIRFTFFHPKKSHERHHIRLRPKLQQQAQVLLDAIHSVRKIVKWRLAICFQMRIPVKIGNHAALYERRNRQSARKHEAQPRFRAETQRSVLEMVIVQRDAPSCFEHHWNSSRKNCGDAKLYFIGIADLRFASHLRGEFKPTRDKEIGRPWNNAQSGLIDQKLVETPALWDIKRDGDPPKAVASILEW